MPTEVQDVTSKTSPRPHSAPWGSTLTQVWWKSAWKLTWVSGKQARVCTWNSGTTLQTRRVKAMSYYTVGMLRLEVNIYQSFHICIFSSTLSRSSFLLSDGVTVAAAPKKKKEIANYNLKSSVFEALTLHTAEMFVWKCYEHTVRKKKQMVLFCLGFFGCCFFLSPCVKKGHSSGCKFKTAADWKAAAFPWLPQSQNMIACELLHFMDFVHFPFFPCLFQE